MTLRRKLIRGASLAFLVAALCLASVVAARQFGRTPPDTQACGAADARGRVGVSDGADMLTMSVDELSRSLRTARDAGIWSVRVDVDWSRIERVQAQRDWSEVDRVIQAVTDHGLCAHGLITYAPSWAANPSDQPHGAYFAPAQPDVFAQFARDAATRYRESVQVWEVWNEPNTIAYFKPAPDPGRYAVLLTATYTAIKAVSPKLTVLSGGLAPAEDNGLDIAPTTFLAALYAVGANRYFDAFAIHPYSYPALPDDLSTREWNTALRMNDMRDIMVDGADGTKQIWITECGAPTGTGAKAVSDETQSQSIGTVLQAARDIAWLGPAFVYSLRDSGTDAGDPEQNFGILRHDFSPKPSFAVVRQFASES